jgi:hypothetical protein
MRSGLHSAFARVAGPATVCLLLASGCAAPLRDLAPVRGALAGGDIETAVAEFEKRGGKEDDLLFLLEKGYMMHLAGRWDASNEAFEAAERRAEDLYTKSISQEAAALLTSDLVTPYRSAPFELQMVPYYRALNYLARGERDEALVEARKANQLLAVHADKEGEGDSGGPRRAAFLQYFTGLLYEAQGDANDAVVAMREAARLYEEDAAAGCGRAPSWLAEDFYAVAGHVGLASEVDALVAREPDLPERARAGDANNLVVFVESGFVPHREEVDIVLPIFEDAKEGEKGTFLGQPAWYVDEYGDDVYAYRADRVKLDHVLRFAFPELVETPSAVRSAEVVLDDGSVLPAEPALDLGAAARADFERRLPGILLKTVARAIAKEAARREGKEEDIVVGWIINAVNVATERADTRGWGFLPERIAMLKARVPAGRQSVRVDFRDGAGELVETVTLDVAVAEEGTTFVSARSFR